MKDAGPSFLCFEKRQEESAVNLSKEEFESGASRRN